MTNSLIFIIHGCYLEGQLFISELNLFSSSTRSDQAFLIFFCFHLRSDS